MGEGGNLLCVRDLPIPWEMKDATATHAIITAPNPTLIWKTMSYSESVRSGFGLLVHQWQPHPNLRRVGPVGRLAYLRGRGEDMWELGVGINPRFLVFSHVVYLYNLLPRVAFNPFLNCAKEFSSTSQLGRLFQSCTTLWVKNLAPASTWQFLSCICPPYLLLTSESHRSSGDTWLRSWKILQHLIVLARRRRPFTQNKSSSLSLSPYSMLQSPVTLCIQSLPFQVLYIAAVPKWDTFENRMNVCFRYVDHEWWNLANNIGLISESCERFLQLLPQH